MKITFIRPHIMKYRATDALEPLVFAILASLTPPDIELVLYDERLEPIPYDEPTDLVALTVETFTAKRAYQIAAQFRKRGVPVVMGGYHPTLLPDEAGRYADAIAIGDAETIWPQIVADARGGNLRRVYQAAPALTVNNILPQRSIFKGKAYGALHLVQFGRGCRFACDFCSVHAFYGGSTPRRCVENVVAELDGLHGQYVLFADDNLFNDRAQAENLFKSMKGMNIHWACQISLDIVKDPYLLDLMRENGCIGVFIGFESLNPANLEQMKKKWNTKQGEYIEAIAQIYARGIMVFGSFVFGYDHDTQAAFQRTFEFAMQSKLALAQFNPLIPTPATPIYNRLKKEDRLLFNRWWLDDDFRYGETIFRPKNMTPAELQDGVFRLRSQFNTFSAIFQRMLEPRSNARTLYHLFAYMAINLVTKKEIHNKQGMILGDGSSINPFETV